LNDLFLNIITHTAFGTITFLVGMWGGHRLAIGRDRRKEFNDAASTFRNAFTSELSAIRNPSFDENTKTNDSYNLLKEAFGKHRTAYEAFRLFLESGRRNEFDEAWINYHAYDNVGDGGYEHLLKYSPGWGEHTAIECRNLAITNIEKLLEFAQHK